MATQDTGFGFSVEQCLQTATAWTACGSSTGASEARVGPTQWRVTLGDFPDEPLYTLFVDGNRVGDFDDWPAVWTR